MAARIGAFRCGQSWCGPLPTVTKSVGIVGPLGLDEGVPVIRDDKEGKDDNSIFFWDAGDKEATGKAFEEAEVKVSQEMYYPRIHPAPMETCGTVADYDVSTGEMTIHLTSQAPHAHRTLFAIVSGLPEHQIRIISPDIGVGFGNKVPIYPGYVCAAVASLVLGRPVKWMETRSENLMNSSFARDYHMVGEIAAASGMDSQRSCFPAVSGTSIGGGSGEDPGMSNGVPSGITPVARRTENLLCWARSRSISIVEKPHG